MNYRCLAALAFRSSPLESLLLSANNFPISAMAFSVWSTFSPLVLAFAVLAYAVWTAVYRIYLSPISHFPGPKLAALTLWYYESFKLRFVLQALTSPAIGMNSIMKLFSVVSSLSISGTCTLITVPLFASIPMNFTFPTPPISTFSIHPALVAKSGISGNGTRNCLALPRLHFLLSNTTIIK